MSSGRKIALLLVAGAAFGVLMAVLKGQDTGVRDALGNTSAPWIVLPFVAGASFPRVRSAALAGLAVTLVSCSASMSRRRRSSTSGRTPGGWTSG